jgi:hypothetical protein
MRRKTVVGKNRRSKGKKMISHGSHGENKSGCNSYAGVLAGLLAAVHRAVWSIAADQQFGAGIVLIFVLHHILAMMHRLRAMAGLACSGHMVDGRRRGREHRPEQYSNQRDGRQMSHLTPGIYLYRAIEINQIQVVSAE